MSEKQHKKVIYIVSAIVIAILLLFAGFAARSRYINNRLYAEQQYKIETIEMASDIINERMNKDSDSDIYFMYTYYREKETGVEIYFNIYEDKELRGNAVVTMANWEMEDSDFFINWLY